MPLPKLPDTIFNVEIPSTKKLVRFRQFKTREEKILLMAKAGDGDESEILSAIKQIVNNIILNENFDVDTLTSFDLEWLFLKARAVSVSNIVSPSYKDHEDGEVRTFNIDLNEVKIIWPIDKPPVIDLADGIKMSMKWPTAGLYSDKGLLQAQGLDALERLIVKCIDKIYTADEIFDASQYTTEDLLEFINDFDIKAFEQIQDFFGNMPRMEHVIEYTNNKGTERRIVLNSLSDFFQF
jgi:hypothetical protein